MRKSIYTLTLLAVAAGFGASSAMAQSYSARKLATLGGSSNYGQAINNKGQVAGFSATTGDLTYDPYLTGANGLAIADVGSLGGYSLAYGVNDIGQVVGYGQPAASYNGQAFVTGPNGTKIAALGAVSATVYSRATAINNDGLVIGYFGNTSTNYDLAFITRGKGAAIQTLGTLGGGGSLASAINGNGRVVGYSETALAADDAFITGADGAPMNDLGIGPDTAATAINNRAQVAGTGSDAANNIYGFITAPNGGVATRIGTLGGANSYAFGISNTGQVVGWAQIASGDYHAYVYRGGTVFDLNAFVSLADGAHLVQASAINDRGQIVAQASDSLTYLLSPPIAEQLAAVQQIVAAGGAVSALAGKLSQAAGYFGAHDLKDACLMLNAFGDDARSQAPRTISPGYALELLADAQGLSAAMGCEQ